MLIQMTLEKLRLMKLTGMAKGLEEQMATPDAAALSFDSRIGLLVDREESDRNNRRLLSRLKTAKPREQAFIEDIDYSANRGLDKSVILSLAGCEWLRHHQNVLITGATGVGKTFLGCALLQAACRAGFTARYVRVPRLLQEIAIAKGDGSYSRLLAAYAKTDLLLLDDWGLAPMNSDAARDILEIVEDRYNARSSIIISQVPPEKWYELISDPTLADAILDRVIHRSHKLALKGPSMRKERAKPKASA